MSVEPLQINIWQSYFDVLSNDYGVDITLCQYLIMDDSSQVIASTTNNKEVDFIQSENVSTQICRQIIDNKIPETNPNICYEVIIFPNGYLYGCLVYSKCNDARHSIPITCHEQIKNLAQIIISNLDLPSKAKTESDTIEQSNRTLLDSVNIINFIDAFDENIWIKNNDGEYIACNSSAEKSWALTKNQIIGKTDASLFDPETAMQYVAGDRKALLAGKKITTAECEVTDSYNNKIWIETLKTPIKDSEGDVVGVIGLSKNIAENKKTEEQLMLTTTVFENAVEGVVITDINGTITDINHSFTRITGYERDEVIGQNPRILRSGRHDSAFYEQFWNSLLTDGEWHGEIWNRRKNGSVFPQLVNISSVYSKDNQIKYFVAVFADISDLKQTKEKLKDLAYTDPLTQLPNRLSFLSSLGQEINLAKRTNTQFAILFIDIDLFKNINDSLGHLIGDEVIIELANRLTYALSEIDIMARLGGDEFAILLPKISGTDAVSSIINVLCSVFENPFHVSHSQPIRLTASMGVSIYPNDGLDADSLLRNTDAALYRAKSDGRNNFAFYTQSMTDTSVEQLRIQTALHRALTFSKFHLHYQPKVCLKTNNIIGFEALIRLEDEKIGMIPPATFIPVAEEIGMIVEIGLWVLFAACRQGVEWLSEGKDIGRISVNVAFLQLQRTDFVEQVKKALLETGFPAKHLELEVTESSMMQEPKRIIGVLTTLRKMGVALSIDDFGTGYSSMSYLKDLPVNTLKIDKSFILDIQNDSNNQAITKAVIALGHAINKTVIAEGVETQEQVDFLRKNNCDYVQGYFFSKPDVPSNLNSFLKST